MSFNGLLPRRVRPAGDRILRRVPAAAQLLFFGTLFGFSACATSPPPPPTPVVSPTGIVYEVGVPPVSTRFSEAAITFLSEGFFDRALEQARAGLAADAVADTVNPLHFLLAGLSTAGLGDYATAMDLWERAREIYPAYELEVEPARETAWAEAFNAGIEAYDRGEVDSTIVAWRKAVSVYDLRPDVHENLAVLLAEDGEYEEAIDVYRAGLAGLEKTPASWVLTATELEERALARRTMERDLAQLYLLTEDFSSAETLLRRRLEEEPDDIDLRMGLARALSGEGRHQEAGLLYRELLLVPDLEEADYFNIGASLFEGEDFLGAAEAFRRVTEFHPYGRDSWFNYANALLAAQSWDVLVSLRERLTEVDPLGENTALILARAHLEIQDEAGALQEFERTLLAPVHVDELELEPLGLETIVTGRLIGNEAVPGTEVVLRFIFYSGTEEMGSETMTLPAPAKDEGVDFQIRFDRSSAAYRYELVEPVVPAVTTL